VWLNFARVESLLETRRLGRRLIYYTSTQSTQDIARAEAENGAAEGTLVAAEEQTAGRGRFGRTWVSPAGLNLYLTLLLRPPVSRLRSLSILAPLAVSLAAQEVTRSPVGIKWPNDVQMDGKKIAGILIESELSGAEVRYALLGIGLNVNQEAFPPELAAIATSLKRETGRTIEREEVLASLLNHIERLYESVERGPAVFNAWRERLVTLGKPVTVRFREQSFEGTAEDVDHEGNLVVRMADGRLQTFEAGEVSLRGE
jgi:BirA family biotin operon repressor/biotin-[acetyl-CoA-carboxylase] ligase